MKEKIKNYNFKKWIPYFVLFVICVILLAPLISSNSVWGHDSFFHISNIKALDAAFTDGNWLFPKIMPMIANDFGYGTQLFYGPLAHWVSVILIHVISFVREISVLNVIKIVHFSSLFLSGVFMYQFAKKLTKKESISLIAAIVYITFPYHLSEIYIRDSYAESIAFLFLPLIFNGLYELLFGGNRKKFYLLFILGATGLILTHTITTLYAAIFVIIFLLFNIKKVCNKTVVKRLLLSGIFVVFITGFYTVPLLEQKLHADINIFSNNIITDSNTVSNYALNVSKLFAFEGNQSTDGIIFYVLIPVMMMLVFSIFEYKKLKMENKKIFLQFFILGIICLIMSTNLFPWKHMPSILLYIQFPWRMLIFASFFLSVASIVFLFSFKEDVQKAICLFLIMFLVMSGVSSINIERVMEYNTDNVDVSTFGIGAVKDYFPTKVLENYEYYENRSHDPIIVEGSGEIEVEYIDSSFAKYTSHVDGDKIVVEFPMFYYYGYSSYCGLIPDERFEVRESKNGFVEVVIDKSCGVTLNFVGSKISQMSTNFSIFSAIGFFIFMIKPEVSRERKK